MSKKSTLRRSILYPILAVFALALIGVLLMSFQPTEEDPVLAAKAPELNASIPESYLAAVSDTIDQAANYALSIKKTYTIPADALVAPEPDQSCYGTTKDPASLQWLLDEAAEILDGQDTLFSTDIEIYDRSEITYYLDETIFAITWQQVFDDFVYTISEIKVADSSQFRRYLADGEYDSAPLYTTSKMSSMVNAVVASSGDYYRGRKYGITVYEGQVQRFESPNIMDTCFVDYSGNLILAPRGQFETQEDAQKFVDENDISFSLAFGPILVSNGERCEPQSYAIGEVNGTYPRAALCQRDELHYLLVVANGDGIHWEYPTIHTFAKWIDTMGCQEAYSLDGGQTAVITMNDEVINHIQFNEERPISDIIYFATALPNEEENETGSD